MAAALTLGACTETPAQRQASTGSRSPSAGAAGAGTAPAQAPAPALVSPEQYRVTLNGALDPIDAALEKLGGAKGYKGLARLVTGVEQATAGGVAKLAQTTPPSEATTEHANLLAALRAFQSQTAALNIEVDDREYCTGSAVRTGLGRSDGTAELRKAAAALAAKIPGARRALALPADRSRAARPANGFFVRSGNRGGRGTLTIENGGGEDAVIKATRGGAPAFAVYVRRGKDYRVSGVGDGTYRLFFTSGGEWDAEARAFGRDCRFQRFDDTLRFKTTFTATQIRWSTWRISLQPVAGGTASISDVSPDSFPDG